MSKGGVPRRLAPTLVVGWRYYVRNFHGCTVSVGTEPVPGIWFGEMRCRGRIGLWRRGFGHCYGRRLLGPPVIPKQQ